MAIETREPLTTEVQAASPRVTSNLGHAPIPGVQGIRHSGRVERWRGGLGDGMSGYRGFPCVAQNRTPCFRFHLPLVEPDVRICRIRLSDQKSRLRPRKGTRKPRQAYQAQSLVQILIGEPCSSPVS